MFRVYLNATSQHPRKEEWIEAVTGSPSWAGGHWDFLDAEGLFVSRLKQDRVNRFEEATDRRQPRHVKLLQTTEVIRNERVGDPPIPASKAG